MPPQPAPSLISSTAAELRNHAPFDAMDSASLTYLTRRLKLEYFPQGSPILLLDDGIANCLFIVQKGAVVATDNTVIGHSATQTFTDGECFPLEALIARQKPTLTYAAAADTFCYRLGGDAFEHVMDISRDFRHYAVTGLAALVEKSRQRVQSQYTARVADADSLSTPLKALVRRAPISVVPGTPIRRVLQIMQTERVGSVLITDEAMRPLGIFTERDVLDRVALGGISQDAPIDSVMTPDPFTLPSHASVLEAAQAMARFRFRHVIVMEEGRMLGMVSEHDLFSLQRLSLGAIAKAINHAESADRLAEAAGEVRRLAGALLAHGLDAEHLTQFVTTLNDAVVSRVLTLAARTSPPPLAKWCWLGLGSEGRMEQTLSTDQDNAILFDAPDSAAAKDLRPAFLAFAEVANVMLDQCGFPLCRGEIMAKNPRWCLASSEWRDLFGEWMRSANPEALLNAAIFFDFRALAGDMAMADELRVWLNAKVPMHTLFLRQMAINALQVEPPLGILRDFVVDDGRGFPGTIDLKTFGARPFIDAARIFALSTGVSASNTAERLRIAGPRLRMREDEIGALIDAFHFIQLLRLRHQESGMPILSMPQDSPSNSAPNRIDPQQLNPLDRRILRESLRQARMLQSRLKMDYQI